MKNTPNPKPSMEKPAKNNENVLLDAIPKDLLFSLLDNPYESLLLVDADGFIRFMSKANEPYYGVKVEDAIGRPILEVNPDSELMDIIESGRAKIGRSAVFKNHNRIISRFPLRKGEKIVGAIGKLILLDPQKAVELYERTKILEKRISYYTHELQQVKGNRYTFDHIIGESQPIRQVKAMARRAAKSDSPIIISGESGTDKELFAHAIHQASLRREHPFISINCSAIPAELIESELFGYSHGAFTGSSRQGKKGKFEMADKGTVFLDEIGDMPLSMQVKLLRVLQEGEIEKIGSPRQPKRIDFRVVCATNRNLEELVRKGEFRLDLYYRINVVSLDLPPLRRMKEDIPLLVKHQLGKICRGDRKESLTVSDDALAILKSHNWPGNMRELKNVIERAMIYSLERTIMPEDLPLDIRQLSMPPTDAGSSVATLKSIVETAEKKIITKVLKITGNNKRSTARILGINRSCLYHKLHKYGFK